MRYIYMDEQDGAILGQPEAEHARTGPHGVEEDAGSRDPQHLGYRAPEDDDSPTAGTVLPGEEDSLRDVGFDNVTAESAELTLSPSATLDLAAGRGNPAQVEGDPGIQEIAGQAGDARELAGGQHGGSSGP